jgi:nucleoside-diphosphate-sugar epimerase
MKILVTGACGYKGHVLVPKLLAVGHEVTAFDIQWFGCYLEPHDNLKIIKGNVLDLESIPMDGIECIIHLSSVANDPCSDLDPKLTWEISALATMQLADRAARIGIKRFIYASSGSVYGVKEEDQVYETLELKPLSEYNKTKMVAERVLLSYSDVMTVQILRPATVCGFSPRMRLDVSVNLLTMAALTKNKMTVFGGDQIRPNIHIDDITDAYLYMLDNPQFTGIYNAGFENISILDIAKIVQRHIDAEIEITASPDIRSYRINSDKLLKTGFRPKKNVEIAVIDMIENFKGGILKDHEQFHNLKWMQKTLFNKPLAS